MRRNQNHEKELETGDKTPSAEQEKLLFLQYMSIKYIVKIRFEDGIVFLRRNHDRKPNQQRHLAQRKRNRNQNQNRKPLRRYGFEEMKYFLNCLIQSQCRLKWKKRLIVVMLKSPQKILISSDRAEQEKLRPVKEQRLKNRTRIRVLPKPKETMQQVICIFENLLLRNGSVLLLL